MEIGGGGPGAGGTLGIFERLPPRLCLDEIGGGGPGAGGTLGIFDRLPPLLCREEIGGGGPGAGGTLGIFERLPPLLCLEEIGGGGPGAGGTFGPVFDLLLSRLCRTGGGGANLFLGEGLLDVLLFCSDSRLSGGGGAGRFGFGDSDLDSLLVFFDVTNPFFSLC